MGEHVVTNEDVAQVLRATGGDLRSRIFRDHVSPARCATDILIWLEDEVGVVERRGRGRGGGRRVLAVPLGEAVSRVRETPWVLARSAANDRRSSESTGPVLAHERHGDAVVMLHDPSFLFRRGARWALIDVFGRMPAGFEYESEWAEGTELGVIRPQYCELWRFERGRLRRVSFGQHRRDGGARWRR
jgi:hypothetical protein